MNERGLDAAEIYFPERNAAFSLCTRSCNNGRVVLFF
jgi:hypothetical protein